MRRRDFIKEIVGSAVAWSFAARGQQGERMRRIGVRRCRPNEILRHSYMDSPVTVGCKDKTMALL